MLLQQFNSTLCEVAPCNLDNVKSGEFIDGRKKKDYIPHWLFCEAPIKLI